MGVEEFLSLMSSMSEAEVYSAYIKTAYLLQSEVSLERFPEDFQERSAKAQDIPAGPE